MHEHSNQTILLIDDDDDTRAVLARQIAPLGINIVEATNGQDALNLIKGQSFDVVVSDLVMPRMSGNMLLHSMLQQGFQMPFILVTGFGDKDSAIQALRLGAFDYLEKPVHLGDIQSVLTEALRVSREQQRVIRALHAGGPTLGNQSSDRQAEIHILKMRILRFQGDPQETPVTPGGRRSWEELKDLYVQESEPQLTFFDGALQSLSSSEDPSRDFALSLRIIQSFRLASEAVRINDVAELAWTVETALAGFKSNLGALAAPHVRLMTEATAVIRSRISSIGSPEARAVTQELTRLTTSIAGAANLAS